MPFNGTITSAPGWNITEGQPPTKTVTYNSAYGTLPTVVRTGYAFKGWFTAASGGTQVTAATIMGAQNVNIFAQWAINAYTLTANANGGTIQATDGWAVNGATATKPVTYNSTYGSLPYPTRRGYHFEGWFTAANGGTKVTTQNTMPAQNVTIYAHWVDTWLNHRDGSTLTMDREGYYLIDTAAKLANITYRLNFTPETAVSTIKLRLSGPIDISQYYWVPIGVETRKFSGTFDGQNHAIIGIKTYADGEDNYIGVGLFGYLQDAVIKNVNIDSGEVYGDLIIGSIAGSAANSTITNCVNRASVGYSTHNNENGKGTSAGGIVGSAIKTTISNCKNYGMLRGKMRVGGIAGFLNESNIIGSYNYGSIGVQTESAGGISAYITNNSLIDQCLNSAIVVGGEYAGGIVGRSNSSTVSNSFNDKPLLINPLSTENSKGGVVGYNASGSSIIGCGNNGVFTTKSMYAGGVAGYNAGRIKDCFNSANITLSNTGAEQYLGGIAGKTDNNSVIEECLVNCEKLEDTSSTGTRAVGGIVGLMSGTTNNKISHCFVDGISIIGANSSSTICGVIVGIIDSNKTERSVNVEFSGGIVITNRGLSCSTFFGRSDAGFNLIVENSYARLFRINNIEPVIDEITAEHSSMDNHFSYMPNFIAGYPVPLGIFAISDNGTKTGIVDYLRSQFNFP